MASISSYFGPRKQQPNVAFYENKIPASPNIEYIEEILTKWSGDFKKLEENHHYIQWLFPNREPGQNPDAFPFTPEEAKKIRTTPKLKERMKRAFEMMLEFFGMKLTKNNEFQLTENAEERLKAINTVGNHNFNRITRILNALLEFGHERLMLPWLKFLAVLIYQERLLDEAKAVFDKYWCQTLDAEDKIELNLYVEKFLKTKSNGNKTVAMPTAITKSTTITTTAQTHTSITKSGSDLFSFGGSTKTTSATLATSSIRNDKTTFDKTNYPKYSKIVAFYKNEFPLPNSGELIKDILNKWKKDDEKLMKNPYYIHWLFPTQIQGIMQSDVRLSAEDAQIIRETPELRNRVLNAFEMMLGFYGMKRKGSNSFDYTSLDKLKRLNKTDNPHLKYITRILSALKELGYKHLMLPWLKYLASFIYEMEVIPNAESSMVTYWMSTLDAKEKKELNDYILFRKKSPSKPSWK